MNLVDANALIQAPTAQTASSGVLNGLFSLTSVWDVLIKVASAILNGFLQVLSIGLPATGALIGLFFFFSFLVDHYSPLSLPKPVTWALAVAASFYVLPMILDKIVPFFSGGIKP